MDESNVLFLDDQAATGQPQEPQAREARRAAAPEAIVLPGLTLDNRKLLTRGIRKRRGTPLMGYTGLNGWGKSFCMIRDTLPSLAEGRRVLSTVPLLDPQTGNPHPLYVRFEHWSQLEAFENGDILLDEVTGIMDSRDSGMPKKVRKKLPQMRRAGCPIRWTGIDWDNSDRRLRQITQAVTMCRGYVPNGDLDRADGQATAISMWRPNRLFLFTTYDATTLAQSEDGRQLTSEDDKKRRARVMTTGRFFKRELVWGPGSLAFDCYNTLGAVDSIDNSCERCGGRIAPDPLCKGHDDDGAPSSKRQRREVVFGQTNR